MIKEFYQFWRRTRLLCFVLSAQFSLSCFADKLDCKTIAHYNEGATYSSGAEVKIDGKAFSCIAGEWCTIGGPYSPPAGWASSSAWFALGECQVVSSSEKGLSDREPKGDGLKGVYFSGSKNHSTSLTRIDESIDLLWQEQQGAPATSVRWTGQIQPRFSDTYHFFLHTNANRRLFINDQLIINSPKEHAGIIWLNANQRYDIRIDVFGVDELQFVSLDWSSPQQTRERVPKSQLYSGGYQGSRETDTLDYTRSECPAWSSEKDYFIGDIVIHHDGKHYLAKHSNPGYDPLVSRHYWRPTDMKCGGQSSDRHSNSAIGSL